MPVGVAVHVVCVLRHVVQMISGRFLVVVVFAAPLPSRCGGAGGGDVTRRFRRSCCFLFSRRVAITVAGAIVQDKCARDVLGE